MWREANLILLVIGVLSSTRSLAQSPDLEAPHVEILESRGEVGGAPAGETSPHWKQLRLALSVINRLPADVHQLEVDVTLVNPNDGAPIPGWRFETRFDDAVIPALDEIVLRVERPLPPRRQALPANQITYLAKIKSYRLAEPNLSLAVELLQASSLGDQTAAIRSYDPTYGPISEKSIREVLDTIRSPKLIPGASSALRLFFVIRVAGEIKDPSFVEPLLELEAQLDPDVWSPAILDLSDRMRAASESDEPRLAILPSWARRAERAVVKLGARDAFENAVKDTLIRYGDIAVPDLVLAAGKHPAPAVRALANSLLHAMGRSTVRSRLSLADRDARVRVIDALGELGSPEPVAQLAELVTLRDQAVRLAAMRALRRIGPAAVEPLVDALGTPQRAAQKAILTVLEDIGPAGMPALRRSADRYGITLTSQDAIESARQLADELSRAAKARWHTEIERGLQMGREGRYDEAFRVLDGVYGAVPTLYMERAKEIAALYLKRGEELYRLGNYDSAITTLRIGQSIHPTETSKALIFDAQLELARGFIELDETERAEEILNAADASGQSPDARMLRAQLLARRAEIAVGRGEYAKARALVDRARRLEPNSAALEIAHRKLLVGENLLIILVLALLVPGALLVLVLGLRRRIHARRMRRIEDTLDLGP